MTTHILYYFRTSIGISFPGLSEVNLQNLTFWMLTINVMYCMKHVTADESETESHFSFIRLAASSTSFSVIWEAILSVMIDWCPMPRQTWGPMLHFYESMHVNKHGSFYLVHFQIFEHGAYSWLYYSILLFKMLLSSESINSGINSLLTSGMRCFIIHYHHRAVWLPKCRTSNQDHVILSHVSPHSIRPSAGTELATKSDMFSTKFLQGLTHCGLVTPYGNIDRHQHWLR